LMLPAVIRVLGLANAGERELHADKAEELLARRRAIEAATECLDRIAVDRSLPDDLVRRLRKRHQERLIHFEPAAEVAGGHQNPTTLGDEIELLLISAERSRINELYRRGALKDGTRRRLERELDLREANLANHEHDE